MNEKMILITLIIAFIVEGVFFHRYIFCSKKSTKKCRNKLCDYYGNGMCERSEE